MKPIIISFLLFVLCSFASAEPWIGKSKALDMMEVYLQDYEEFNIIGTDTIEENNVMIVYPYSYGLPKYVGYFKVRYDDTSKIIAFSIDITTGKLISQGVGKKMELRPDMIADSASFYETIMNFLDSNHVKEEIESMTGRCVYMMHFMSCGGVYGYFDCLGTPPYFWLIHFEDGEDYLFYYTDPGEWKMFSVSVVKKQKIQFLKEIEQ